MHLEKEKFKRFITVLENRSQVMREPLAKRYVSARPSEQIMPYGYTGLRASQNVAEIASSARSSP